MKQNEIKVRTKLLDENGNIAEPGWCRKMLYDYSRKDIKTSRLRLKEWNFYQVANERYTVQMTVADIGMGGAVACSLFDRETGEKADGLAALSVLTLGRYKLPEDPDAPMTFKKCSLFGRTYVESDVHHMRIIMNGICTKGKFRADFEFEIQDGAEYLTMAVPFEKEAHFYLNKKQHCMPVRGVIECGDMKAVFDPKDSFGTLDWGRGVWPYHNHWYWGGGTQRLPDGKLFGFEIGWGFGIMEAFTENTLFYDGKAHKIGKLHLKKPHKHMWLTREHMKPWVFISDDGRFEMTMTPLHDHHAFGGIPHTLGMHAHQVWGKWNGTVTLDDGTKLEIKDMTAFCENVENRW